MAGTWSKADTPKVAWESAGGGVGGDLLLICLLLFGKEAVIEKVSTVSGYKNGGKIQGWIRCFEN